MRMHQRYRFHRGSALIYVTVALVVMAGFVSLAVDLGRVHVVKGELQLAADAAARYALTGLSGGPTIVETRALTAAQDNKADGSAVVLQTSADVEMGTWDEDVKSFSILTGANRSKANAVRVTARRIQQRNTGVPLMFARVLGLSSCDVEASAIASLASVQFGVVGLDYINMKGNSTVAYWSTTGQEAGSFGNIGSNGDITLSGSSSIQGNARPGVGKQVYGSIGRVSGTTDPLLAPLSYPTYPAGSLATSNDNGNIPASYQSAGSLSIGSNKTVTLAGGKYYFNNVTISGTVTFASPTIIFCYGNFSLSGNAVTNSSLPKNLIIVMCPTPSGGAPGTVNVSSGTSLYAAIYGPTSRITLAGNGDIYGLVVGKSIDMTGTSAIHYDLSISGSGGAISLVK